MKVLKYPLKLAHSQSVDIHKGFHALSLQMQHGCPTLWAECDESAPIESVHVVIVGTGIPLPWTSARARDYLGSVQDDGYVWHVFVVWGTS